MNKGQEETRTSIAQPLERFEQAAQQIHELADQVHTKEPKKCTWRHIRAGNGPER
jgi:hypothetical protein